jgi:hypothetical protein
LFAMFWAKVFTKVFPGHGCPSLKVFLVITS